MAQIYLPARSKTYRVRYYNSETRQVTSITTKKTTEREAKKFCKDFEAKLTLHLLESRFIRPQDHKYKLSDASKIYIEQNYFSDKTNLMQTTITNHLITSSGNKYLFQYSKSDYHRLLKYFDSLRLRHNSKAGYLRHINSFFNWMLKENFVKENPFKRIPEDKTLEVKTINLDDLDIIFEAFKQKGMIKQYKLFKLTYLCAFRSGEAIKMEAKHFDVNARIITVHNQKGKRVDKIPMIQDVLDFIVNEIDLSKPGIMFPYKSPDSVRPCWNTVMKNLGLKNTIHQLRKTRGTYLANAGVEPLFLQQFMRHKYFDTTRQYYINIDINRAMHSINAKLAKFDIGIDIGTGSSKLKLIQDD